MKGLVLSSAFILILSISCATFPSDQLTFDMTGQTMPIMLNKDTPSENIKTFKFESGFALRSVTHVSSSNGNSTSSTATLTADINKPLQFQMNNLFLQEPAWIYVTDLSLYTRRYDSITVTSIKYLLELEIIAPTGK
ncbi:MAG: hypothetical protein JW969_06120 [Spirochaetales bacterium]|nr:hypothetical protein [Spirochaetales bacterium]